MISKILGGIAGCPTLGCGLVVYDIPKLKTRGVHAPESPTARTNGDIDQTCREKGTSGFAAFGIFKRTR